MAGLVVPFPNLVGASGTVPVVTLAQMQANEKAQAEATQQTPVVQGLAGFVKQCFTAAYQAKRQTVDERLLKCLRQRHGKYDPDVLGDIQKSGGSAIYMMLTANKCRAAGSWIKDVMFGTKDQKPWSVEPTREPELSPDQQPDVAQRAMQEAMNYEAQTGQPVQTPAQMKDFVTKVHDEMLAQMRERAEKMIERMSSKMEDQLQEGGYYEAMSAFIDDLVTFPYAVMKGPVARNTKELSWIPGQGGFTLDVQDKITLHWERVDPFNIYWAPHASDVDDGFVIERHQLTRAALTELLGVEGYDEGAIRAVLDEHGRGGLKDWLSIDASKAQAEGKSTIHVLSGGPEPTIDALQMWGSVQGKMLIDWGMDEASVPDPLEEYPCEVWVCGHWVIKATLNSDPRGRKPYYKTCYEKVPGSWDGNGVCDLVRDAQAMCNAAARALSNNMGIASGPMSYVNVERLPPGEDVTQMYPWRVFQVMSDPYGGSARPVEFFQPMSNAQELMAIYEKFAVLADEYSGVPRYMTGDAPAQGAGRTASGMSMLMGNAGKAIKQVIGNIDLDVTEPLMERLYYYNMKYSDNPDLKGDIKVVARGVNVLVAQEQAQVRMNEILNIIASNPILIDIVGEEAIADLLREVTKPLNMDIVPPKEVIRARMIQRQQMQMLAMMNGGMMQDGQDGPPQQQGGRVMPQNRQRLKNGAPVTDNFSPSRRA